MSEEIILKKGQRTCPKCGSNLDGGSIVETFIAQRNDASTEDNYIWKGMSDEQIEECVKECYSEPYRWGREIGIELPYDHPNHYDGVSYWQCPDCGATFNRFTGKMEEIK